MRNREQMLRIMVHGEECLKFLEIKGYEGDKERETRLVWREKTGRGRGLCQQGKMPRTQAGRMCHFILIHPDTAHTRLKICARSTINPSKMRIGS